jgi:peptide/nickel transport system substrate-binding protein
MTQSRRIVLRVLAVLCVAFLTAPALQAAPAGPLADVPRNRTLISGGWDFYAQVPAPTNFNPYAGVLLHQRNSLHYTVNEMLFYTNHNSGRVIPWQGESWSWNDTFTVLTVKIRKGVKWSDGTPFTARDVVFTFNMLKRAAPDLVLSSAIVEWVKDATATDDLTVRITLNKPGPRWANGFLAQGQAARFVVVPEHIWKGQDPKTFTFYDPTKGWPVGTGPYRLVRTGSDSIVYDRRETWWAVETKLVAKMPEVQRIVYRPTTPDAVPQLFINSDIDIGRALQVGTFEAIRAGRNPKLVSWNGQGPVWGGPDGCVFRLVFNAQKPPFNDPDVRWALNHTINRQQIVDLAYEGSVPNAVVPFSSYAGVQLYLRKLKDLFEKFRVDSRDLNKTAELLTRKGFRRDAGGRWIRSTGERWPITVIMDQGNPIGPVLVQQLQEAGFEASLQVLRGAAFFDAVSTGNFETALNTHCGSADEPWQTLEHFHSKYSARPGERITNIRAPTRYSNPQLDQILDQMEAMRPSPLDEKYVDLVRRATEIYLRDMPQIVLAEEYHVVTFNATYWTGYPTAANPYVAPYLPWEGFNLIIHRLKAAR